MRPTLDLAAGRLVFDEDLSRALAFCEAGAPEELGWRVADNRTLLVPLSGVYQGAQDNYLLRLDFVTGRDWPPRAQFVNPETLIYVVGKDTAHLPKLTHSEVQVHPAYNSHVLSAPIQLICCSATLEYYDVLHGGDDAILWQARDTFLRTLSAIGRGMASEQYTGRHPVDAT